MTISERIDLTHPIHEGMLTFHVPWHPIVEIAQLGRISLEGRESRKISFGTHTGTHMDAPLHFVPAGRTIDQIPLDVIMGEVTICDFTHLGKNQCIEEEAIRRVPVTDRIIFKFGWGRHWDTKQFYHDWPYFSRGAAEYLVSNGVKLVGMDTPSPDDCRIPFGSERDSEVHKIFLSKNIVLVEYLANLDQVSDYSGWSFIALPLKIRGSDGSPVRAVLYR
jgi:arylformamidase